MVSPGILRTPDDRFENLEDFPFTNPTVPLLIVFGAFTTMITLGTLIGFIPAERAVSIKPIDALREE